METVNVCSVKNLEKDEYGIKIGDMLFTKESFELFKHKPCFLNWDGNAGYDLLITTETTNETISSKFLNSLSSVASEFKYELYNELNHWPENRYAKPGWL
jgi:hypothetical protein